MAIVMNEISQEKLADLVYLIVILTMTTSIHDVYFLWPNIVTGLTLVMSHDIFLRAFSRKKPGENSI